MSPLTLSIQLMYLISPIVLIALIIAILWHPPGASKAFLIVAFTFGLLSLSLFQFSYLWALRSSLAVAFAGGAILVVYSCLAIATGILGNRIFPAPWSYASVIVAIYGVLVLFQRMKFYWLIRHK